MIRVYWIKPHHRFAYSKGDIGYVTPEWCEKLLKEGYVMVVPEVEILTPKSMPVAAPAAEPGELPADIPARAKLIESGYNTIDSLKDITTDALLDAGVSKTLSNKVIKYLKGK